MGSGWTRGASALAAVAVLTLGACSDEAPVVSADEYEDEAARLCDRHGEDLLTIEELEALPMSDAARAAFLGGELVPAARAIIRSLDAFGYPADRADGYHAAAVQAFEALDRFAGDAIGWLDLRRDGLIVATDDPFAELAQSIEVMEIPC